MSPFVTAHAFSATNGPRNKDLLRTVPTNAEVFLRVLNYPRKEILASDTVLPESKKKICGGHAFFRNWFQFEQKCRTLSLIQSAICDSYCTMSSSTCSNVFIFPTFVSEKVDKAFLKG